MPKSIDRLRERGQSVWLDFIHRGMLDSGQLERYVRDGWITGLTSNPTIFNKAIAGSAQYDDALRAAARARRESAYDAFVGIAGDDLRRAADIFRSVYDATEGADGYVSFEAPPGIEDDAEATVREAHRLREAVGRPNVMNQGAGHRGRRGRAARAHRAGHERERDAALRRGRLRARRRGLHRGAGAPAGAGAAAG